MTFPTTSATLARTDAGNTFLGHQVIEGVTSTGATGTGKFVFSDSPVITGHLTVESVTSTGAAGTGKFVFSNSPALTGVPTAPTAVLGTDSTQIATNRVYSKRIIQLNSYFRRHLFMSTILIKKNDTIGHIPASGDLTNDSGGAEIAVNTADGKIYTKNSAGEIVELIKQKMKKVLFFSSTTTWVVPSGVDYCIAEVCGGGGGGAHNGTPTAGANSEVSCGEGHSAVLEGTQ